MKKPSPVDVIIWTCVLVFVATSILTVLSFTAVGQFVVADYARQPLFTALILEIVAIGVFVFDKQVRGGGRDQENGQDTPPAPMPDEDVEYEIEVPAPASADDETDGKLLFHVADYAPLAPVLLGIVLMIFAVVSVFRGITDTPYVEIANSCEERMIFSPQQSPDQGRVCAKEIIFTPGETTVSPNTIFLANKVSFEEESSLRSAGSAKIRIVAGSIQGGRIISNGDHGQAPGAPGKKAGDVFVAAAVIDSLSISANGGDGAKGETGPAGRNGENGNCSGFGGWNAAQNGGDGLPGGDGGNGGTAGNILILTARPNLSPEPISTGGHGGAGGDGGPGGHGGAGCTGAGGSQPSRPNGVPGPSGNAGRDGPDNHYTLRNVSFREHKKELRKIIEDASLSPSETEDAIKRILLAD